MTGEVSGRGPDRDPKHDAIIGAGASQMPAPKKDPKKEVRLGPLTGMPLIGVKLAGANYRAEKYEDLGPLVIKTARGEIKAVSGDIIVYYDDPTDKEKPQYLHVIPWELVELLGSIETEPPPDPVRAAGGQSTPGGKPDQTLPGAGKPDTPTKPDQGLPGSGAGPRPGAKPDHELPEPERPTPKRS